VNVESTYCSTLITPPRVARGNIGEVINASTPAGPNLLLCRSSCSSLARTGERASAFLHALNGVYVDLHGKRFYAVGEAASHGTIGVNQMIHDLAFDCPLIVCYSTGGAIGHATLLTSITYTGPWGARASRSGVAAHLAAVGRGAAEHALAQHRAAAVEERATDDHVGEAITVLAGAASIATFARIDLVEARSSCDPRGMSDWDFLFMNAQTRWLKERLEETIESQGRALARAAGGIGTRADQTRHQVNRLELTVRALCEILVQRGLTTPEQLATLMQQIDLLDGREDDVVADAAHHGAPRCVACDRYINPERERCVYCDAEIPRPAPAEPPPPRVVACGGCKREVPEARSNFTARGLRCDACFAAES
jgi:hypothetical protein